jgi:diacylglycerol kinase family enzyme
LLASAEFKSETLAGADMTRIACILNPKARDGLSAKQWEKFEPALAEAGFEVDLHNTQYPGHATEIAHSLSSGDYDLVVAVGGDGTVHEVASGLRGSSTTLGILPIGTGNDYARAHGIPTPKGNKFPEMQGAVDILVSGVDRRVGAFRVEGPPAKGHKSIPDPEHHLVDGEPEVSGNMVRWSFLEIDSGVTSAVNRMKNEGKFKWIRGQLKYQLLGIRAILGWRNQPGWIKIDDEPGQKFTFSGLFCMSQCQTFGGGFKVTPGAYPTQGNGSLLMAFGLSKLQMLLVMGPLEKGTHVGKWGKISMRNATRLEVRAVGEDGEPTNDSHNPTMFVNVDGEAVLTTPISMAYHEDQLSIRGAASIPNE